MSIYFNGAIGEVPSAEKVEITNPATGDLICTLSHPTKGAGKAILDIAEKGYAEWSSVPLAERADTLMRFADLLADNAEQIAQTECEDMGKPISECRGEVAHSANVARAYVEKAKHVQGRVISENQKGLHRDIIFTKHEPLGIILCIIPFNYPVELYIHKVIAALVMGNAVIVKLPSDNPLSLLRTTELLVEAGVPASAVQLVYANRHFVSQELTQSPRVAAVTLTGSTQAGIEVWKDSAETLHRVYFELGGNDPLLIFADADLDYAADEIVSSRMGNTGQICCASKRFIVHRTVAEALVEKLKTRLDVLKRGDPKDPNTQLGCIISAKAAKAIMKQIEATIAQGAKCVYGNVLKNDTFIEPTILVDVTREMDIAKDMEVFGPVIPIIAFEAKEEAISIANQSCYGLEAAIITKDMEDALNTASKLQAGSVVVNGGGSYRHMDMPFGGYKMSGIGRESVSTTLEEFSQEKNYIIKNVLG